MYTLRWQNMKFALIALLVVTMLMAGLPIPQAVQPAVQTAQATTVDTPFSWDNATVYFVITDRFYNGNTANDTSYGRKKVDTSGKNIGTFHGGDVKGLTEKLKDNYFTALGVNAIWITAPYEQVHGWVSGGAQGDFAHYAYHGYYPLDWTAMDKNFGTVEEFREFVDTAHSQGIRVVMDVVLNHVGYGTLADMAEYRFGGNDAINNGATWDPIKFNLSYSAMHGIVDYNSPGSWDGWWNRWVRAGLPGYTPAPPLSTDEIRGQLADLADVRTDLTTSVGMAPILNTKWNKERTGFDPWIVPKARDLRRDLNIAPADYIIRWLAAWVEEFGIDGFRADTAKHVEMWRWKQLGEEADKALKRWRAANPNKPGAKWTDDFWMTAEVFGLGMGKNSYHTNGGFDSTINFDFQGVPNNMNGLDGVFSSYANQLNNNGGWNVLNYLSSHDTFLYNRNNLMNGGTALLLAPGAAQIFYGDETGRAFGATGSDKDQGTRSSMNWDNYSTNLLQHWQRIGTFRAKHLAVGAGQHRKIADSPYTFSRTYNKNGINDKVVIALGATGNATINVGGVFANGTTVRDHYTNRTATVTNGSVTLQASTNSVTLLEEVTGGGGGGGTVTKPATPAGLNSMAKTTNSVTLSWNAVTGAAKYNVYRNNAKVGESTTTSYTDSNLTAATAYSYTVSALNASNTESDRSAAVSVTTNSASGGGGGGGTPTPPVPPTNVDTEAQTRNSITLTWTAPAGVNVKAYNIYRDGKKVGTTASTKYTDTGLQADTDYAYQISTINNVDTESNQSDVIYVTTLPGSGGNGNVTSPIYDDQWDEEKYEVIDLNVERLDAAIEAAESIRIPYDVFVGNGGGSGDGGNGGGNGGGGTTPQPPTIAANPEGGTFSTEETTVTLNLTNATEGKYTIDGSDPKDKGISFKSGDKVTFGATINPGESLTLKLYVANGALTASNSYVFTKEAKPQGLQIYFKKPAVWKTPQLYYYGAEPTSVPGVTWATAPAMTNVSGDWFMYEIAGATSAYVIFKDSDNRQFPAAMQPGFLRSARGWYDGMSNTWLTSDPLKLANANKVKIASTVSNNVVAVKETYTPGLETGVIENVNLRIPYSQIAKLRSLSTGVILELRMPNSTYDVHVDKIEWASISRKLNNSTTAAALDKLTLNVYFERVDETQDMHAAFGLSLERQQAEAMSDLYRFAVKVTNDAAKEEWVNEVPRNFISRKIKLVGDEDTSILTAVSYNPKTGASTYLPVNFKVIDGVKYANIYATHHGLVGLATAEKSFVDISAHPAKADIELMASKLVVSGTTPTTFSPNSSITRGQFATMLVRALGLPQDAAAAKFRDIRANDWFAGAVGTAFKYGLVAGRTPTEFRPRDTISRQEMLVMLSRVNSLVDPIVIEPVTISNSEISPMIRKYRDFAQIAPWAQRQVAHAAKIGIIDSVQGSTLAPRVAATRGDATRMIKRTLDYALSIN